MAFSNDTKPSGSWTNDSIAIKSVLYNDSQAAYNESIYEYNETDKGVAWDFDSVPSAGSYTNDSKP